MHKGEPGDEAISNSICAYPELSPTMHVSQFIVTVDDRSSIPVATSDRVGLAQTRALCYLK